MCELVHFLGLFVQLGLKFPRQLPDLSHFVQVLLLFFSPGLNFLLAVYLFNRALPLCVLDACPNLLLLVVHNLLQVRPDKFFLPAEHHFLDLLFALSLVPLQLLLNLDAAKLEARVKNSLALISLLVQTLLVWLHFTVTVGGGKVVLNRFK
jgi:hypothetical protein